MLSKQTDPLEVTTSSGGTVVFIPSIHGRWEFAASVRHARYDAVAVEMNANMAESFLSELHVHRGYLPGVLAIARSESSGSNDALEIIPIISTDSMCEAVRLADAAGKPVYGIDLDAPMGATVRPNRHLDELIPDPISIKNLDGLRNYVERIQRAPMAFLTNAAEDFGQRNMHMARRLIDLAARFPRVLAVIGLAHYSAIRELLLDGSITPLRDDEAPRFDGRIRTTVLHPQIACPYMDRFPRLAHEYELARTKTSGPEIDLDVRNIFRNAIDDAYRNCQSSQHRKLTARAMSFRERLSFEQLLTNYSTLANQRVPDLTTCVHVARATMPHFAAPLIESLMKFPWLRPDGEPRHDNSCEGYPYLQPHSNDRRKNKVFLDSREYALEVGPSPDMSGVKLYEQGEGEGVSCFATWRTWPPDDRAAAMVCRQIFNLNRFQLESHEEKQKWPYKEVLSFLDGVDVRETMRRAARGELESLAVRESRRTQLPSPKQEPDEWAYPVVFVFSNKPAPGSSWSSYYAPLVDAHRRRTGEYYHGIVGFGVTANHNAAVRQTAFEAVVHFAPVFSSLHFSRLSPEKSDYQAWIESGHREEVPIGGRDICSDMGLRNSSPVEDAISLAIRHSRANVSFVLPDHSQWETKLRRQAEDAGKVARVIWASQLPTELLNRVRTPRLVAWEYEDEVLWHGGRPAHRRGIEQTLGENCDAFSEVDFSAFAQAVIQ